MSEDELLSKLWEALIASKDESYPACRFQEQYQEGRADYRVCRRCVYIDYKPSGRPLKDGKLYPILGHELLPLDPMNKVHPENFLCEEGLALNSDNYLHYVFIPCNNMKDREVGLMAFEEVDDKLMYKGTLPYSPSGSFHFVGLAAYRISKDIIHEIEKAEIPFTQLHPRICKVRSGTVLALQLMSESRTIIATLNRLNQQDELNDNIYFGKDSPRYKLDGFRNDSGTYYQLVEAIEVTMRGLKNPVKKLQEQETPVEPQIEDIQPEQAEEIAAQAPTVDATPESMEGINEVSETIAKYEEGDPETVATINKEKERLEVLKTKIEAEKADKEEAAPKHTRVRKQPTAAGPAKLKQMDELIEYLGSPVGDMKQEDINEEIKKIRDLIIVSGRRMANLHSVHAAGEKKRLDSLRAIIG